MQIHSLYRPVLKYFRTKRMRQFADRFKPDSHTTVLDVGGDPFNWMLLTDCPIPMVTYVNVYAPKGKGTWVIADGCNLPLPDKSFDIAYSNSVIEHVGTFERQRLFARECQRVGCKWYVQTPNRWFFCGTAPSYSFYSLVAERLEEDAAALWDIMGIAHQTNA